MRELPSVERGQVIAQRYVLSKILRPWLSQHPAVGIVCLGVDAILDTPVVLYMAGHEHSGDLLDSARRAALLTDPRQPHVLDVLSDNGLDIVVAEERETSSLVAVLERGPVSPQAAAALVGELATVLAHAATRGLHHLCLGPESVGLTADNDVVLTGIGIDASVANVPFGLGMDTMTPAQAKRTDALALIDLYYACLSGRWPGAEDHAGIEAAGLKNNRVARLSTFVKDLPSATEEFVSDVVSGIDPGPRSPSEIVRFLEPWDTSALAEIPRLEPLSAPDPLGEKSTTPSGGDTRAPAQRTNFGGTAATQSDSAPGDGSNRATSAQLQAALAKVGMTRPGVHGSSAGVDGNGYSQFDDRMTMRKASTFPLAGAGSDDAVEWNPDETIEDYRAYAAQSHDINETRPITRAQSEDPVSPEAADGDDADIPGPPTEAMPVVPEPEEPQPAPQETAPAPEDSEEDGSWFLGGMFTTREQEYAAQRAEFEREKRLQQQAAQRVKHQQQETDSRLQVRRAQARQEAVRPQSPAPAAYPATNESVSPVGVAPAAPDSPPPAQNTRSGSTPPTGQVPAGGAAGGVAAAPGGNAGGGAGGAGAPSAANSRPSGRGGKIAAIVVAAVIVVGLVVFGGVSLLNNRDSQTAPQAGSAPTATDTQSDKSSSGKTTKAKSSGKLHNLKISKVTPRDPDGDGSENNSGADNILSDSDGVWKTDRYNNASFGNLKKGLGLELKLKKPAEVKQVKVRGQGKGGSFQIRVGGANKPKSSTKVGKGKFENATTTVKVKKAPKTQHVYVWITKLPTVDGQNRASIKTVKVYG